MTSWWHTRTRSVWSSRRVGKPTQDKSRPIIVLHAWGAWPCVWTCRMFMRARTWHAAVATYFTRGAQSGKFRALLESWRYDSGAPARWSCPWRDHDRWTGQAGKRDTCRSSLVSAPLPPLLTVSHKPNVFHLFLRCIRWTARSIIIRKILH